MRARAVDVDLQSPRTRAYKCRHGGTCTHACTCCSRSRQSGCMPCCTICKCTPATSSSAAAPHPMHASMHACSLTLLHGATRICEHAHAHAYLRVRACLLAPARAHCTHESARSGSDSDGRLHNMRQTYNLHSCGPHGCTRRYQLQWFRAQAEFLWVDCTRKAIARARDAGRWDVYRSAC